MQEEPSDLANEIVFEHACEDCFENQNNQNVELGRLNDFLMNHHDELDDEEFEELEEMAGKMITLILENKEGLVKEQIYIVPDLIVPEFMRLDKYKK